MRRVHHSNHRLECEYVTKLSRAPAGFFLYLARGSSGGALTIFNDSAGQFPSETMWYETISPHHEYTFFVVHNRRDGDMR